MIVYVETNFVLELAFLQEEHSECRSLLNMAKEHAGIELALPAFSIGEAYEASERKRRHRRELHDALLKEIGQLARSRPYETRSMELRELTGLLLQSGEEQGRRLDGVLGDILGVARILPLDRGTFAKAVEFQKTRSLGPQDSIVYASVMVDLEGQSVPSCFITRNASDFSTPDIENEDLEKRGCKLLTTFAAGLGYASTALRN